jgi:hypothetical protein
MEVVMRFQNSQMSNRFQLLFLVTAMLAMNPSGAVQVSRVNGVLPPLVVGQPFDRPLEAVEADGPVKLKPHHCAPWATCKGQPIEQRVEKKGAMLLTMMLGLKQRS